MGEIGARVGFNFEKIQFGGIAVIGKDHVDTLRHEVEDIDTIFSSGNGYDNLVQKNLSGGFLNIHFNQSFGLAFEYYPFAYQHFLWTEESQKNLFSNGDHLQGTGGAAGFKVLMGQGSVYFMYRKLEFTSGEFL